MEAQDEATKALLQEKNDLIEQLQSELAEKRAEVTEARNLIGNLKEELDIQEQKQTQVAADRDQLSAKLREQNFLFTKQQEVVNDKDEQIEQLQATVEILTSGKNFIKKSYDSALNKLKKMQEDNILIPKKKEEHKEGASAQSDPQSVSQDNELNQALQNELRQLHFKLRQKDQIISEFKREAQAYYSDKQSSG
jgi:chromosome segregation ATPase